MCLTLIIIITLLKTHRKITHQIIIIVKCDYKEKKMYNKSLKTYKKIRNFFKCYLLKKNSWLTDKMCSYLFLSMVI